MSGGLTEDDIRRRRSARRFNEHVKLWATFQNNVAVTILAGAVVIPWVNATAPGAPFHWGWSLSALGLHLLAQLELRTLKSED